MAAATDVDLTDDLDFDIDIDDFDAIQAMEDLLAHDEFRGGGAYYSAIFSDADIVSHCRHGCEEGDGDCGDGAEEEEAGSSPADSGVTDDGPLALAAVDDDDAEAMSAYVAELERFLLEDDDDDAPCREQADGLLGVVDDYFAGDQLLATAEVVPGLPAAGGAGRTDGEEKEEEEENGDGGGGDVLAAREDEQSASRKRARSKCQQRALATSYGSSPVVHVECGPVGSSLDLVEERLGLNRSARGRPGRDAKVGTMTTLI